MILLLLLLLLLLQQHTKTGWYPRLVSRAGIPGWYPGLVSWAYQSYHRATGIVATNSFPLIKMAAVQERPVYPSANLGAIKRKSEIKEAGFGGAFRRADDRCFRVVIVCFSVKMAAAARVIIGKCLSVI